MNELETPIERVLADELKVSPRQVWAAIKLLDNGATVPFIARYRKEATGQMTDTHLRLLADRLDYLRELESRRIEILKSIEEQGKLSQTLKKSIEEAHTKSVLEDLYLPFRPKKHSKAQVARDCGLEPLALKLLEDPRLDPYTEAKNYVNPDKAVPDSTTALNGAREILIERFSEDAALIGRLRDKFWTSGWIFSKGVKEEEASSSKFTDYFNYREEINKIPSHRALALFRGQQEGELKVSLETEGFADYSSRKTVEDIEYIQEVCQNFGIKSLRRAADAWLAESVRQTWKYRLRIRLELDIFSTLRRQAEEEAIKVFAENLRNLLLAAPAGACSVLGLDPGFRTGVKVAALDKTGKVLETAVIYPHPPEEKITQAQAILIQLVKKHNIDFIAIGNGTASRETEKFVHEALKTNPEIQTKRIVVSEAGASVYSASELASLELPQLDVSFRGAVSIGRRLQDPLAELVKVEPKSIGVGQYQHDVNQRRLEQMLHHVVEDCVNSVGVEINTASVSLLSYVSGLTKKTAAHFVAYREKNGLFKNRSEFLNIPDMGPRAFEQCAGFLRVKNGDNALDASAVHPESYPIVERILNRNKISLEKLIGNREYLSKINPADYVDESAGEETVRDILAELEKPGRDPRPDFKSATFKEGVFSIEDLKSGMILEGVVTNVANFGAFVDIGVHQDGLVHISELSNEFIQDPRTFVKAGQIVKVKVLDIDKPRRRIALSMR